MSFGSSVRERLGGWRRRGTPLVVSGVLHAALLVGLAAHRSAPVNLTAARPAGGEMTIAIAVPVRITGTTYGPANTDAPTPPFKDAAEVETKPRETVTAGRHAGRRSRPRGLTGLTGKAAAPIEGSAAESARLAAAPMPEPEPPEPEPIDVRPPVPEAAPVTVTPVVKMPTTVARGLRVFDTFPRLPQELAHAGAKYPVDLQICVDQRGAVANVHVERGAPEPLNDVLVPAVRTWRYRPYTVGGQSRPFCHSLRIVYSTT